MSSLPIHSSTRNQLEVPCSMRCRAASAPVSPVYTSGTTPTHPSGSDSIRSPTFSVPTPRSRTVSSINRQPPPRLQLEDQSWFRTNSLSSTTTSSLEASLAELQELIEVLSTPIPFDEEFFTAQNDSETGTKFEQSKYIPTTPNRARVLVSQYEPGPRWI
ncbi:hypothetical protein RHS04_07319 [Rhizoctonia solani]|uniref:Uncharacterized protein n=1 Tax=Rhizoctonia solani TaxID=456999 RepID=A0A8H7H3B5_9AGAM|nr:hypothetical protein RHS04_07319 [Rhizoctonia solani]